MLSIRNIFLKKLFSNSDRFGRWKVLVPTGALQLVFAVGCGFVNDYYMYTIMRFFIAVNTSGAYMVGFVLSNAYITSKLRAHLQKLYNPLSLD